MALAATLQCSRGEPVGAWPRNRQRLGVHRLRDERCSIRASRSVTLASGDFHKNASQKDAVKRSRLANQAEFLCSAMDQQTVPGHLPETGEQKAVFDLAWPEGASTRPDPTGGGIGVGQHVAGAEQVEDL
jgi:hypothetical protein